jgi:hypothetical protein
LTIANCRLSINPTERGEIERSPVGTLHHPNASANCPPAVVLGGSRLGAGEPSVTGESTQGSPNAGTCREDTASQHVKGCLRSVMPPCPPEEIRRGLLAGAIPSSSQSPVSTRPPVREPMMQSGWSVRSLAVLCSAASILARMRSFVGRGMCLQAGSGHQRT